jgi:hypothetical protein
VHEQLSLLEEKLSSWTATREDWQRERVEWQAEREQSQRQWSELARQIAELQSRASEIAGRVERLDQCIAASPTATPTFLAAIVETPPLETTTSQSGETHKTVDFIPRRTSPLEAPTLADVEFALPTDTDTDDEIAPFAEFSIWKQGAASAPAGSEATTAVERSDQFAETSIAQPADPQAFIQTKDSQSAPAKSFIEQYGHMFVDDEADVEPSQEVSQASAASSATAEMQAVEQRPLSTECAAPESRMTPPAISDEEESIEQYMSKLLQRVRGERSTLPVSQPSSGRSAFGSAWTPAVGSTATGVAPSQPTSTVGEPPSAGAKGDWLTTSLGTVRRKAPIVEQPADLETLRALANETARRAISTYGLRTHRRNAITKVIVSMLAGMTSLWLMLEAPNWRDLQFITACVSLIAAAYWAGQTFAELLETFRAAAYDGPEDKLEGVVHPSPSTPRTDMAK